MDGRAKKKALDTWRRGKKGRKRVDDVISAHGGSKVKKQSALLQKTS